MKKNGLVVFLISLWIFLAVIFGIFDLEISKNLVNQNSGWAQFLQDYGMIPGLLVILSGVYIYYSFIKTKSDVWSYIQKVVFFMVSSGLIFHLLVQLLGSIATNHLIIFVIISFAISIIIFIVLHLKNQVQSALAIIYAKVVVAVAFWGYVICIQGVKYFWGRFRFRELDAAFSQFTPWYLPQGVTGSDSFPSGHAAMGFILLPLLIFLSNKKEWIKILVLRFDFYLGCYISFEQSCHRCTFCIRCFVWIFLYNNDVCYTS